MKIKLKNRIVSALLAFAMMASLLPAGLIVPAQATIFNDQAANATITPSGASGFNISFTAPGTATAKLGNYMLIVIPDATKVDDAGNAPSALVPDTLNDGMASPSVMATELSTAGAIGAAYYAVGTHTTAGWPTNWSNNKVDFSVTMPKSYSDTVRALAGYTKPDGSKIKVTDTSIPIVVLFACNGYFISRKGTWGGNNLAELVLEGSLDLSGVVSPKPGELNTEYLGLPCTLRNIGGENAVISSVEFTTKTPVGAMYTIPTTAGTAPWYTLWYEPTEGADKTPIFKSATETVTLKPGESITVWMLRRQHTTTTNTNFNKYATAAGLATRVLPTGTNTGQAAGTIGVVYDSIKEGSTNATSGGSNLKVTTDWTYTVGGSYKNLTTSHTTKQYNTTDVKNVELEYSGTVPTGGITIKSAYFADATGNANVEILGVTVPNTATSSSPTTINKVASGSKLPLNIRAANTLVADWPSGTQKQLTIVYNDGEATDKEVKVTITVIVEPDIRSTNVTVYLDDTGSHDSANIWKTTDRKIALLVGGVVIQADTYSNGVFSFNSLPDGTYPIVEDDGSATGIDTGKTVTVLNAQGNPDQQVDYYTVTVAPNPAAGGSTWIGSETTDNGVTSAVVLKDKSVTIHASANGGYSFQNWTGTDDTLTSAVTSRTINGTKSYTANFTSSSVTVQVNLDGAGDTAGKEVRLMNGTTEYWTGTTDPTNKGKFTLTAVPTGNYTVQARRNSTDTWEPVGTMSVNATGGSATVNYYTYELSAGTGGTASDGGGVANGQYLSGKVIAPTATPSAGYKFTGWTGTHTTAPTTLTAKTVMTANFAVAGITWQDQPNNQTITYGATLTDMFWRAKATDEANNNYPITYTVTVNEVPSGKVTVTPVTTTALGVGGVTLSNITGQLVPVRATAYKVTITATDGVSTITSERTIKVNKALLKAPAINIGNHISVSGGSDGVINFPDPGYPAGAGVNYSLVKGSTATGKTNPDSSRQYTGLNAGTYYVQATITDTANYAWDTTGGNNGQSNSVTLTEPGVNNPSISQSRTYEKNTAITTRAANIVFDFNVGDWSTLTGLTIGGTTIDLTKCTVTQPTGSSKDGTVTIPATYLDTLSLTNGVKSVVGTFSRAGITPLTATASDNLLTVQTTYTVKFDLNGGTADSGGATSIPNQTTTSATVPTFTWSSIVNKAPTRSGYAFAGWSTDGNDNTADWTSATGKTSYQPSAADWNSTVYAAWTANVVTVTVNKDNKAENNKVVTLVNSTGAAPSATITKSGNVTTFSNIPAGTYKILVGGEETNHTVTVTVGGTKNETLDYYSVYYAPLTSATDHGAYSGTPSTTDEVLVGGRTSGTPGTDENLNFVTLPGLTPDTNYVYDTSAGKGWSQTLPASRTDGTFSIADATGAGTWKITQNTTGSDGVTLKPSFTRSGYALTVTVKKDNVLQGSNATTAPSVTVKLSGAASKSDSTNSSGQVVFNNLKAGTYTITVSDGTHDWRDTHSVTITNKDMDNVLLEYFTVTAATGTGAATASVTDPTTAGKIVMKGKTATLASSPQDGYNGPVTWTLTKTNGDNSSSVTTSGNSGGTVTVKDTVTATASYTANVVTVTTKLNGAVVSGRKITLYDGTTATSFTGTTNSSGVVTFSAVPAKTYNIYDELTSGTPKDTGVDVTVTSGSAGNGGSAEVRYYDVNFLAVATGAPDYGIYTGITSPAVPTSGNIIINSNIDGRRAVSLPGTTPDTNYTHSSWSVTSNTGNTANANSVGAAPAAGATSWTPAQNNNYSKTGAITLKPGFTKTSTSIQVTVKRNGSLVGDNTAVHLTDKTDQATGDGSGTTGSGSGATMFVNITYTGSGKTYTASAADWVKDSNGKNDSVTVSNYTTDPYSITLNYYDYMFDGNKPGAATTSVGMTGISNSAKPVLTGYSLDYPGTPTLSGYTFKGWSTNKDAAVTGSYWLSGKQTIDGNNNDTTTGKRIYYAIWQPVTMSLANMTGKGAMQVSGISGFTTATGTGGGGTTATDYTYSIVGNATIDGVTVAVKADGTGFSVSGTPVLKTTGLKSDKTYDIVFNVQAVSKINGQSDTATITINVEPTYHVVYDLNKPVASVTTTPAAAPTDSNVYVATASGLADGNSITVDATTYTWPGGTYTHSGWALSKGGSTNTTFGVAAAVAAQSVAPGGNITLYAKWVGEDYSVEDSELNAIYHQGVTNANGSTSPDWVVNGFNLDNRVNNGGGKAFMTYTVESTTVLTPATTPVDSTTKLPPWLEIVTTAGGDHLLKVKDGMRVGDVDTYTIKIKAHSDSKNEDATMTITIKVTQAMPVIDGLAIINKTHYAGDPTLPEMTYVHVRDPYVTAAEETAGTYTRILTTGTSSATETKGSWAASPATLAAATTSYKFTYTPADTKNYLNPDETKTIPVVARSIVLHTRDDLQKVTGTDNTWAKDFTNGISQSFTAADTTNDANNWTEIKVNIKNAGTNSPVDRITATQNQTDANTFKDIKLETVTNLATGADELILTFKVKTKGAANGTHTLKYTFNGTAGPATSQATATATYTFTLDVGSSSLPKVQPVLSMVQTDGTNEGPFNGTDRNNKNVDSDKGGLHLAFPALTQEAEGAVKEYVVTLTGNGGSRTERITADGSANYYFWWPVDDKGVNDINPTKEYTVTIQAVAQGGNYTSSTSDPVKEYPGRKLLTIDMITNNLNDRTFNGQEQSSSTNFGVPTGISNTDDMWVTFTNTPALDTTRTATKLHVNMTETATNPALTSDTLDHDYYIWVYVQQTTYYLALGTETTPVAYNTRTVNKATTKKDGTRSTRTSPHENWEIVQAQAVLTLGNAPTGKQNGETVNLSSAANPRVTYAGGSATTMYYNGNANINAYYDISYILKSAPTGSTWKASEGTDVTASMGAFVGDVSGGYTFTVKATYKTTGDGFPNLQFQADVSEVEKDWTFTIGNRTIKAIDLIRYEAVNGNVGISNSSGTNDDEGPQRSENRTVTYGTTVEAGMVYTDAALGYYSADTAAEAKEMRLEGLRVIVTYSNNTTDAYVVGRDTLPADFTWNSNNANVTVGTDADGKPVLKFNQAGITTGISIGTATIRSDDNSKPRVQYTMAKKPLDYTATHDAQMIYNANTSVPNGKLVPFDPTEVLAGDTVNFTGTLNRNDANIGIKNILATGVALTVQTGTNQNGFYTPGNYHQTQMDVLPKEITQVRVEIQSRVGNAWVHGPVAGTPIASARASVTANGLTTNQGLTAKTYSVTWEVLKDDVDLASATDDDWEPISTGNFLANRKYRPTVQVQADGNHYLVLGENYNIRNLDNNMWLKDKDLPGGDPNTVVTVDSSGPFASTWLDENIGDKLHNNPGTFRTIYDLTVTPELRFEDFNDSGHHHAPAVNLVHIEAVDQGASLGQYTVELGAYILDVYDVNVGRAFGDLIDMGAVLTPLTETSMLTMHRETEGQEPDKIRYTLDLSGVSTATPGTYMLTLTAKGSAEEGKQANDVQATYTFALVVSEPRMEPAPMPVPAESIIVLYWVSLKGKTNDLTGEKILSSGGRPTFVPKIIGLDGWVFKGWSETDPTLLKDGEKPKLVDPLTIPIYEDKIYYAYYEKEEVDHIHFVRGYPDGTFHPDAPITRAEVATIIARSCLEGFVEGSDYGNPGGYSDIGTKRWYTSAVSFCSMAGVFTGYPDGTFRPNDYITRQELTLVVGRLAGLRVNMGLPFEDANSVNKWARDGVYTCYILGYVGGYNDGTFKPKNNITRAETVKIFNGYLNRGVDKDGLKDMTPFQLDASAGSYQINGTTEYLTWEDVPEKHWAYYEIIEASNDHDFHWNEDKDGKVIENPPEDWEAVYIEAEWRYRATYAMTWVLPEGEMTGGSDKVSINQVPMVPVVTAPEGRIFLGWSLTEDGSEMVDPSTVVITGAQTFYGIFADDGTVLPPKTFTVTYLAGEHGDLFDSDSETVTEGSAPAALPEVIAHEGYEFLGWSLTEDGMVLDVTTIMVTADMTFYAVYREEDSEEPEPPTLYVHYAFIEGFEDGKFYPSEAITRATVADMVARTYGADFDPNYAYDVSAFADVPANYWAANAIGYCVEKGIFGGYPDGTFLPEGTMTRQEFSVVIAKMAGVQTNQGLPFTDAASVNKWARDYVYTVYINGWIGGYKDGSFQPKNLITRAEAVKILCGFLGRNVVRDSVTEGIDLAATWSDFSQKNWAYPFIMEATNTHTYYLDENGQEVWVSTQPSGRAPMKLPVEPEPEPVVTPEPEPVVTPEPETPENPENPEAPEAPVEPQTIGTGTVNAPSGLNFRVAPDVGSDRISILQLNDQVEILEKQGDWYQIRVRTGEGTTLDGFVMAEYITLSL